MQHGTESRLAVDPAIEAKAIADVVEAFRNLDPAAIGRVLEWASKRYGARAERSPARERLEGAPADGDLRGEERPTDLAELYTVARPRTESESVLMAAYWHQVIEGADTLDSQTLNGDLKHLGRGVGNVTRACSVLIHQRPALMLQVKKAGSTKQARKQYRLTAAGIQRVREMLAEREEADGAA